MCRGLWRQDRLDSLVTETWKKGASGGLVQDVCRALTIRTLLT